MNIDTLNLLPDEILLYYILPNLSDDALRKLCQVNTRFKHLCHTENVRRRVFNIKVNKYKNMKDGITRAVSLGDTVLVAHLLDILGKITFNRGEKYIYKFDTPENHKQFAFGGDATTSFEEAIKNNDLDMVNVFLDSNKIPQNDYDSAFYYAVIIWKRNVVKLFMEKNKVDKSWIGVILGGAIENLDYPMVDLLLQSPDIDGERIYAAFRGIGWNLRYSITSNFYFKQSGFKTKQELETIVLKIFIRVLNDPRLDIDGDIYYDTDENFSVREQIQHILDVIQEHEKIDLLQMLLQEPKIRLAISLEMFQNLNDKYQLGLIPHKPVLIPRKNFIRRFFR